MPNPEGPAAKAARPNYLERAVVLYHQERYGLMEAEVRKELAEGPDDALAHAWLGLALFKQHRVDEALEALGESVRLRPDLPFAHYVRAAVLYYSAKRVHRMLRALLHLSDLGTPDGKDYQAEAEKALAEALRLDPGNPKYFDLLADIRLEQGRPEEALEVCQRGLALDPRHTACLQQRALLLARLGRAEEARAAFQAALAEEPENATVHLEFGRLLLLKLGAPGAALEHLREALRLAPDREDEARPLIVRALRERYPLYRLLAAPTRKGWAQVAVFSVATVLTVGVGHYTSWPLASFFRVLPPLLIGWLLSLTPTCLLEPLFNLVLCLRPFGRLVLSGPERRQCWYLGGCLALSVAAGVGWLLRVKGDLLLAASLYSFLCVVPIRLTFELYAGRVRRVAQVSTALCLALGALSFALFLLPRGDAAYRALYPYAFAVHGGGFYCMFLPYILLGRDEDFGYFRPRRRKRAALAACALLGGVLLAGTVLWFGEWFWPQPWWLTTHKVGGLLVGLAVLGAYFEDWLVRRLEKLL